MKKTIAIIFLLFTTSLFSQENQMETLFGADDIRFGGYGGPEVKFTSINNDFGVLVGGRGGILINSSFTIGLAGYGLVTSHPVDDFPVAPIGRGADSSAYLRMGYGGLHLGFIIEPNKVIHITTGVLIGAGAGLYTSPYYYNDDGFDDFEDNHRVYKSSAFFIAEPHIGAELNMFKFMRMEVSAGYRFVSGLDLPNHENKDLSGFSGNLMFKFGLF